MTFDQLAGARRSFQESRVCSRPSNWMCSRRWARARRRGSGRQARHKPAGHRDAAQCAGRRWERSPRTGDRSATRCAAPGQRREGRVDAHGPSLGSLVDADRGVRTGALGSVRRIGARGGEWIEAFIAAMHRNASARAPLVVEAVGAGGVRRMLDVGGGSAAYSIAFAKANPPHAEVFDLARCCPSRGDTSARRAFRIASAPALETCEAMRWAILCA